MSGRLGAPRRRSHCYPLAAAAEPGGEAEGSAGGQRGQRRMLPEVVTAHSVDGKLFTYYERFLLNSIGRREQVCPARSAEAPAVAKPPKLSQLKCAGHHHKGNISLNALQTEQFLVCRVTSRYNHRFSDRTSIPLTKASPEILQPQFYNTGIVMITNQFKPLLQNQLK